MLKADIAEDECPVQINRKIKLELDTHSLSPLETKFYTDMGKVLANLIKNKIIDDIRSGEELAARQVATSLLKEGEDKKEVDELLQGALQRASIGKPNIEPELVSLTEKLFLSLKEPGGPSQLQRVFLAEKKVSTNTGYNMVLYPNESKHSGFPHVKVIFNNKEVNISIGPDPKVIAGNDKLKGISDVIKAVKINHVELKKEWDNTRPDSQKIDQYKKKNKKRKRNKK